MAARGSTAAPYVVGIDLGTSNTVLAAVAPGSDRIDIVPIRQRSSRTAIDALPLLPSCAYATLDGELDREPALDEHDGWVLGAFARRRGAEAPNRLVASSKSWLCHPRIDKRAPVLPWGAGDDVPKLSVVDVATRLLARVRGAWDRDHPAHLLAAQDVVLTVPASFDEVARELTLEAASGAGLRVRLLEEPQAAFYAAMHARKLEPLARAMERDGKRSAHVLVCDVGGGTTDLSLLELSIAGAALRVRRVAVGQHLLLGGDNMDLALAHLLEPRLAAPADKLEPRQFSELTLLCQAAKEQLLGDGPPAEARVALLARGSQLVGGAKTATLGREETERVVLDGFLPQVERDARPVRSRSALVAFGLPYERDVAITRHVAAFLARHLPPDAVTDAVLLNGGVFRAACIARRLIDVIAAWQPAPPLLLEAFDPDTAVAVGAAVFGLALRGKGPRITGGVARSYFIGVGKNASGVPLAVCVVPKGAEEGVVHRAASTALKLLVGKPARFDLYSSDVVAALSAGAVVEIDAERFESLPPLTTTVQATGARGELDVVLEAELTPVGTLDIACVEQSTAGAAAGRHRLAFDLRAGSVESVPPPSRRPGKGLDEALETISRLYGKGTQSEARDAKGLPRELERLLGERDEWTADVSRSLADRLLEHVKGRRRSEDHERVFFQLVGFCMRPGYGAPGDDQRCRVMAPLFAERLGFPKAVRNWQQFFICCRRIAAGLPEAVQTAMRDELDPYIAPSELKLKKPKGHKPESSDYEILELLAHLEHVPAARRADLGGWILERTWTKRDGRLWAAIGRLGARVPAYASVHHVVSPLIAEKWLDQLLRDKWADLPTAPRAAADMARMTGDRARDVSATVRAELVRRLEREGAAEALIKPVRELVEVVAQERAVFFGERLPSGLRL